MLYLIQRRKAVFITIFIAMVAIGVIFFFFVADSEINRTNLEFIGAYGWQAEETPVEIVHLTIPQEFDDVYQAYDRVNQAMGLHLSDYRGARVVRYSYRILNHAAGDGDGPRVNVFVAQGAIVAADISSSGENGFVRPLNDTTDQIPTEREEQTYTN